jgi:hypothetical protein
LEKLLARARSEIQSDQTLEAWLCRVFGVEDQSIAPVTLQADGGQAGETYWLRADPVYLSLERDQLVLHANAPLSAEEARLLCDSLNAHFATDGLCFIAPHSQRWYLGLDTVPNIKTFPLAQVAGKNVHPLLPQGIDALHWHGVYNEIQMLLYEHPVNQSREARGELPINSVWLWGGGLAARALQCPYARMYSDSDLALAFAQVAGIPGDALPDDVIKAIAGIDGDCLIVFEGLRYALQQGDIGSWRERVLRIERALAKPLLNELRAGRIARLTLDVLAEGESHRYVLTRGAAWKFWRRSRSLPEY